MPIYGVRSWLGVRIKRALSHENMFYWHGDDSTVTFPRENIVLKLLQAYPKKL